MSKVEPTADITGDGYVDIGDLRAMADAWLVESGDAGFDYNADLYRDGKIDNADVDILSANWLKSSVTATTAQYYYHFDGLGSVIALTDSAGNVVESYRYTVYGQADRTSDIGNPYMFTGREYDAETGLYYYRARMYNPGIGRFMQTDPIGYSNGINWYLYCGNNPISWIDPWGLCSYNYRSTPGYNYRSTPAPPNRNAHPLGLCRGEKNKSWKNVFLEQVVNVAEQAEREINNLQQIVRDFQNADDKYKHMVVSYQLSNQVGPAGSLTIGGGNEMIDMVGGEGFNLTDLLANEIGIAAQQAMVPAAIANPIFRQIYPHLKGKDIIVRVIPIPIPGRAPFVWINIRTPGE